MVRVDTTYLTDTVVECAFFQREYTCTIDYGTSSSYTNLNYSDTSSTQGRIANITLSQEIRGDTTYYYIVSAESNSLCVRVRGSFRAGRYKSFGAHIYGPPTIPPCNFQNFISSSMCVHQSSVLVSRYKLDSGLWNGMWTGLHIPLWILTIAMQIIQIHRYLYNLNPWYKAFIMVEL